MGMNILSYFLTHLSPYYLFFYNYFMICNHTKLIINLILQITLNFKALTPMFTFNGESTLLRKGAQKLNPIPEIVEPQKIQPLPFLPFYIEASEPLLDFKNNNSRPKSELEQKIIRYEKDRKQLSQKFNILSQDYMKIKKQYEQLKFRYREGEQIFLQMESQNLRLHHQIQSLKSKKQQKSRINVGIKKKQIPVVKINVPNPKVISQESDRQSIYRQLKTASDELAYVKKLLESEKQKYQYSNNYLSKNVEKLTAERDTLKNETIMSQQQIKKLKQQVIRLKVLQNQGHNSVRGISNQENIKIEKLKNQLQRLQKVHKTCDILISSKQTQISELKLTIQKLKLEIKPQCYNEHNQKCTQSGRTFINRQKSKQKQKQTNIKSKYQAQTYIQESSSKKMSYFDEGDGDGDGIYNNMLEQHLRLSVKQMKSIEQFIRSLVNDFIMKINSLKNQLQWSNQKVQYQKDELERVYEILRTKKIQLDSCYNELKNIGRNLRSTPVKQIKEDDEYLKSLLKSRRNFSP